MTESAAAILKDLATRYRGAPVLTLAQTALWDDPCKAAFKRLLDEHAPDTPFVLGIMDTDYFSRLPKPPSGLKPFDVLPHNDGSTRDLWAAVGEVSCLFGAETPVRLDYLAGLGVNVSLAAQASEKGLPACVDDLTAAWGWRGLAQTQGRRLLAGDVPLESLLEPLNRQMEWAIAETERASARPAGPFAARLLEAIRAFSAANPRENLAGLYLHILPLLYKTLLGYEPRNLEYARSSELLRFNRQTAMRARFRPLDLFLNPASAATARRHYDSAVHASGIATLERFGPHAVPFDVAIPGHGRGTLHAGPRELMVDTDEPIRIPISEPVTNRRRLAEVLETRLGPDIALLGKAVVLITMLAGEFIFLFSETGSPYVRHSCQWNGLLARDGIGLRLYPILRLGMHPWDVVSAAGGSFELPEHLAVHFGSARVSAIDFESRWRAVVEEAGSVLQSVKDAQKPCRWLEALGEKDSSSSRWRQLCEEYRSLCADRAGHGRRIAEVNARGKALFEAQKALGRQIQEAERRKGEHWRSRVMPLREAPDAEAALAAALAERDALETEIAALRDKVRQLRAERRALAAERKALLDDPEDAARRRRIAQIRAEAENEKARRARWAVLTAAALTHTEARPTAWWFPVVDPSGAWFREVERTADYRWESLEGGVCEDAYAHAPVHEPPILTL
jgi:hypothetical protein